MWYTEYNCFCRIQSNNAMRMGEDGGVCKRGEVEGEVLHHRRKRSNGFCSASPLAVGGNPPVRLA